MRKQNKKTPFLKQRPMLLIIVIVLAVALTGTTFAWYQHSHSTAKQTQTNKKPRDVNTIDYSPPNANDNDANNARKSSSSPAPTLNNGPSTASPANFSAKIVSANVNNGNIHVGTLVSGVTSGMCALTAAQGQTTVNLATSNVVSDVNNYDCGAFNISTSQLPTSGTWQLKLTVTNGGASTTDTTSITI